MDSEVVAWLASEPSGPLIPSQLAPRPFLRWGLGPRRLMAAVLVQALGDYRGAAGVETVAARARAREVRRWFERRNHWEWPFSFESICDALSLDPDAVRRVALSGTAQDTGRQTVRMRTSRHPGNLHDSRGSTSAR